MHQSTIMFLVKILGTIIEIYIQNYYYFFTKNTRWGIFEKSIGAMGPLALLLLPLLPHIIG